MSKAALELSVSQSALSTHINSLETRLKTRLLSRTSTGVVPTETGLRLYEHAVLIIKNIENAVNDVSSTSSEHSGFVSVGLPIALFDFMGRRIFDAITSSFPGIKLRLANGMSYVLKEMLSEGSLDLAVLYTSHEQPSTGIRSQVIFRESLYLIESTGSGVKRKPQGEGATLEPELFSRISLALPGKKNGIRAAFQAWMEKSGIYPKVTVEIDSLDLLKELAFDGKLSTVLPASLLQEELKVSTGAAPISISVLPIYREISLCTSNQYPMSAAAEAVSKSIVGVSREMIGTSNFRGIDCGPVG